MVRSKYVEGIPIDKLNAIRASREGLYSQHMREGIYVGPPVPTIRATAFKVTKAKRPTTRRSPRNITPPVQSPTVKSFKTVKNVVENPTVSTWSEDYLKERLHSARSMSPASDIGERFHQDGNPTDEVPDIDTTSSSNHSLDGSNHSEYNTPMSSVSPPTTEMELSEPSVSTISSNNNGKKRSHIIRLRISKTAALKLNKKKSATPKRSTTPQPITTPHPAAAVKRPAPSSRRTKSTTTTTITIPNISTPTLPPQDNNNDLNTPLEAEITSNSTVVHTISRAKKPTIKVRSSAYFKKLENQDMSPSVPTPTHVTAN